MRVCLHLLVQVHPFGLFEEPQIQTFEHLKIPRSGAYAGAPRRGRRVGIRPSLPFDGRFQPPPFERHPLYQGKARRYRLLYERIARSGVKIRRFFGVGNVIFM